MKEIIKSLTESGWKPYNKDETGDLSEMNIEEVFQLVDINNSGYVTKTVLRSSNETLITYMSFKRK